MPLLEDRRFHRAAVGSEKSPETAGEAIAVDVWEVFPIVLLFHGDWRGGVEVGRHFLAGF